MLLVSLFTLLVIAPGLVFCFLLSNLKINLVHRVSYFVFIIEVHDITIMKKISWVNFCCITYFFALFVPTFHYITSLYFIIPHSYVFTWWITTTHSNPATEYWTNTNRVKLVHIIWFYFVMWPWKFLGTICLVNVTRI